MAAQNAQCDALIVDSDSPLLPREPDGIRYYSFPDNIGHLSRGGRDGWGRAFCYGLQRAIDEQYDWVVHVECDSICRLDIQREVDELDSCGACAVTIPLSSWRDHIETGLMFFSVEWLRDAEFVKKYDWSSRRKYPEPETVVKSICGTDLILQSQWRGMRDDFRELTEANVTTRRLDWLTHAPLRVMEVFAA